MASAAEITMPNGAAPPEPKRRKMSQQMSSMTLDRQKAFLKSMKADVAILIDTPQIFKQFIERITKVLADAPFEIKYNSGRERFTGFEIFLMTECRSSAIHARMECKVWFDPDRERVEEFVVDVSTLYDFLQIVDAGQTVCLGVTSDMVHVVVLDEKDAHNNGAHITLPRKIANEEERLVFPDMKFSYSMDFKQMDFRAKIRLLQSLGADSIEFSIYKNEKTKFSPSKTRMELEKEEIMENYFVMSASSDKMRDAHLYYRSVTHKSTIECADDNGIVRGAVIKIVEKDDTKPQVQDEQIDAIIDWGQMKCFYSSAFSAKFLDIFTKNLDGRNKMTLYMEQDKPLVIHFQVDNMTFIRFVMCPKVETTEDDT
jgi:hypothetical protein